MSINNKIWLLVFLTLATQGAYASGQRTTVVTEEAIASYKKLDLEAAAGTVLHYIGSLADGGHLLMVTKTAYPPKKEVKPGVFRVTGHPWDHVFKYFVSADEITIVNGWDISERVKNEGFEMRPSYCPSLKINAGQKKYYINPHTEIRAACLEMRRVRHKFQ